MSFSSEIYRRLDFGISILDEPDERISVQGIEVSVPTRKHRICKDLFPSRGGHEKKSAYERKQRKVKELNKMLKMMLLVPISLFLLAGRLCSGGF